MSTTDRSRELFARSQAVIPGGVNSPVRAFGAVGGEPPVMVRAHGPYLVDADGNDYVDLVCSWGPMILGHGAPTVLAAAQAALADGASFGAPSERELLLAERIVELIDPVEQVRLVNSGTEATMSALRLARGVTGRSKVVKFAGCYHGHADAFLAAAGSGVATLALPDSPGVPPSQIRDTVICEYNSPTALEAVFAEHGDSIAAVITEAAIGNMGVIPPAPGFTQTIRALCDRYGALFISDEVMTGFRASATGWFGIESVAPDLMTFGKVMGGGFPAAAFGGRADVMAHLAPLGPVYQAGTLSGNPVAAAAGLATLEACVPAVYDHLDRVGDTITTALSDALTAAGVPHSVGRAGTMFSLFFDETPPTSPTAARAIDVAPYRALFHAFLARGVYLPPSPFECWFTSAAHDERAIDRVVAAAPAAAAAAAAATASPELARA